MKACKNLTSKLVMGLAMLALASPATARHGGGGGGGRGGRIDLDLRFWTCRAEARDNSGLFFLGTGRSQAEAYTRALETCNRQRRSCIITCGIGPSGAW